MPLLSLADPASDEGEHRVCPACSSRAVQRSRRRGVRETLIDRLQQRAPYRCKDCQTRFSEKSPSDERAHQPTLAGYLGVDEGLPRLRFQRAVRNTVVAALLVIAALYVLKSLL